MDLLYLSQVNLSKLSRSGRRVVSLRNKLHSYSLPVLYSLLRTTCHYHDDLTVTTQDQKREPQGECYGCQYLREFSVECKNAPAWVSSLLRGIDEEWNATLAVRARLGDWLLVSRRQGQQGWLRLSWTKVVTGWILAPNKQCLSNSINSTPVSSTRKVHSIQQTSKICAHTSVHFHTCESPLSIKEHISFP